MRLSRCGKEARDRTAVPANQRHCHGVDPATGAIICPSASVTGIIALRECICFLPRPLSQCDASLFLLDFAPRPTHRHPAVKSFRTRDTFVLARLLLAAPTRYRTLRQSSEAGVHPSRPFWACCQHDSAGIMFAQLAWKGFTFVYAAANLLAVLILAGLRDGAFFKRPSKEATREVQIGTLNAECFGARSQG